MINNDINASLSSQNKLGLYETMIRIRKFEERSVRSYQEGHIGGFCHTYIGQESVAVGTISVLKKYDHIITGYRDHAHGIAIGMSMNECMAEMYGKYTGASKGKGGSMHLFAPKKNFWGGHGIVGGQIPLGTGIAFSLKYKNIPGVCLCYLGDGAINQGIYYESLNLASIWNLPIIYIIENNGYSMGTSQKRACAGNILAKRAEAFDIHWKQEKGYDVFLTRQATYNAIENVRKNSRPMVLEFLTYRYRGHSMSDPDKTYRTKEEIQNYKKKYDCVMLMRNFLLKEKIATTKDLVVIDENAYEEASSSAEFAKKSPFPAKKEILKNIFWETDNLNNKISEGRMFFNKL